MGNPQSKEPISIEEARQLVHSLPARAQRLGVTGSSFSQNFNMVSIGTVAVGAALTLTSASRSVPYAWRAASAVGAFMSLGAAALMAGSAAISQQMRPSLDNEIGNVFTSLSHSPQMREEMAIYMQKHVKRDELDSAQCDLKLLEKALCFAQQKQWISQAATQTAALYDANGQTWAERSNTGAGKQVFLSASYN